MEGGIRHWFYEGKGKEGKCNCKCKCSKEMVLRIERVGFSIGKESTSNNDNNDNELHKNNNIEFNLKNSEICLLIREGYRKGYFTILYNILKERFAYVYYESGLSFEDFVRGILTMEHSVNHNEYVYYLPQGSEEEKDGYEEDENEYE